VAMTSRPSEIRANFWQILDQVERLVVDYEKLANEKELVRNLPQIHNAYIDSIIVHLAKIASSSRNQSFSIKEFKSVSDAKIIDELSRVEDRYRGIIGKIITNRDQLVAHLDKDFSNLCFSEKEIINMQHEMVQGQRINLSEAESALATLPRTNNMSKERYSVRDFEEDLPNIKIMVSELLVIWSKARLGFGKVPGKSHLK
jgi:hypothetical protein